MSYFNALIDFVGSHPQFAVIAVLLLALSEAVPVIGTVVPGSTLILAISALATTADIKPWLLLVAAVVGAIAGDGLSFWLGYRYRREILRGWPLKPISATHRAQRTIHSPARRDERIFGAFHSRGARLCSISRRYPENVIAAFLCGECAIRPDMGADPCLSRRMAGMAIGLTGPNGTRLILFVLAALVLGSIAWHLWKGPSVMPQPLAPDNRATQGLGIRAPTRARAHCDRGAAPLLGKSCWRGLAPWRGTNPGEGSPSN